MKYACCNSVGPSNKTQNLQNNRFKLQQKRNKKYRFSDDEFI